MKRMVKNGDLIDVEPDGSITVAGKPIGGGGSDYTAGSNINISETKEISLKKDITGIESFQFTGSTTPMIGGYGSAVTIKNKNRYNDFPALYLYPYNNVNKPDRYFFITFTSDDSNINSGVTFDNRGQTGGEGSFVFLTKGSRVPFVPSDNGTYVLKATVSNGSVTYTWEAQA